MRLKLKARPESFMFQQSFTQLPTSELVAHSGVLAVISFEPNCESEVPFGVVPVGLQSLSGLDKEVLFCGDGPIERGFEKGCYWACCDDVIFVSYTISAERCGDIENSTYEAYIALYQVLEEKGFAHVFRIWNFMPNINSGEGDGEEYKKFCVGRGRAFDQFELDASDFPATSALGHHGSGAVIYLLASRVSAGTHFENPLQLSAYAYPRKYGPRKPSFARATAIDLYGRKEIFISGTSSIIGHETKAAGDMRQQLEITLENIRVLLAHVDENASPLAAIRVYLRYREDYAAAREFLEARLPQCNINYLWAEVCRSDLLVEIEAASTSAC